METWKEIPIAPGYDVSDHGRVRSRRLWGSVFGIGDKCREIRLKVNQDGYHAATLQIDRSPRTLLVHRLVAMAFIGLPPDANSVICHQDANRLNNHVSNLKWGLAADNANDMIRHGNSLSGERNTKAKLTAADVLKVRELRNGGMPVKTVAERFGISESNVWMITSKTTWSHV